MTQSWKISDTLMVQSWISDYSNMIYHNEIKALESKHNLPKSHPRHICKVLNCKVNVKISPFVYYTKEVLTHFLFTDFMSTTWCEKDTLSASI